MRPLLIPTACSPRAIIRAMRRLKQSGYYELLTIKSYRILWFNEVLVQLAFTMVNFALIVSVFNLTHKNSASSLYVFISIVPAMLFGPITGVVADLVDKRRILLVTDVAMGICFLLLLFFGSHFVFILLIAFLINLSYQFFIPAEAAIIPAIVPEVHLLKANALYYLIIALSAALGYSLAGPIIAQFGMESIFISSTIAMVIGFWLRSRLPSLPPVTPHRFSLMSVHTITKQGRVAFFEGIRYIAGNPRVWIPVIMLVLLQLIASILVALGPGYMVEVLKIRSTDASLVLLFPLGLGLIIGALAVGRFGQDIPKRYVIVAGTLAAAFSIAGIGLVPLLVDPQLSAQITALIGLCAVLLGASVSCMVVPSQTILQTATSGEIRGRIFANLEALRAIGSALPILLVGTVADIFGIIPILISIGIGLLGIAVISYRFISFEKVLD